MKRYFQALSLADEFSAILQNTGMSVLRGEGRQETEEGDFFIISHTFTSHTYHTRVSPEGEDPCFRVVFYSRR